MRAAHGDVVHLAGEHVARGHAPADDRRARAVDARVRSLRAAQAELEHAVALRRLHDAAGLGGDQRLMVDDVEQRRLHQLRLDHGRAHAHDGLGGEDDRALGHGVDVAREPEILQEVEEALVKRIQAAQVRDVLRGEVQAADVLDRLLQARGDRMRRLVALLAIEQVEHGDVLRHAVAPVAVHHRQFIQVGHHRQIAHRDPSFSIVVGHAAGAQRAARAGSPRRKG